MGVFGLPVYWNKYASSC